MAGATNKSPVRRPVVTRSAMAARVVAVAANSSVRLRGAFIGRGGIAAGDQPLARVVGVGDRGQVLGVEQAHLQRSVISS